MAESTVKPTYSNDPHLYLYTSLTSGSSHIVTATSRMETILKANRIPFRAIDIATDEKARMLWGRRAGKDEGGRVRKIPGLVQMGLVIGDLVEVEDWNEYGELKQHVTIVHEKGARAPVPSKLNAQAPAAPSTSLSRASEENRKPDTSASAGAPNNKQEKDVKPAETPISLALRQVGAEAAQKAKESKKKTAVETFSGVGTAEAVPEPEKEAGEAAPPTKPEAEKIVTPTKPQPLDLPSSSDVPKTLGSLQSPNSTAWKTAPTPSTAARMTPRHSIDGLESLQSPNSTAWKPSDVDGPILTHRGSNVSMASREEIKAIEDEEAIQEVDEEDEEDSSEEED